MVWKLTLSFQKRNGDFAAFEIKLGVGYIDEAAENLKKFASNIDASKMNYTEIIKHNYRNRNEPSPSRWDKCDFVGFLGKLIKKSNQSFCLTN